MYIFEMQYKLKSDADVDEGRRLYNEVAAPIHRKIPGLRFTAHYEYSGTGDKPPEWDYVYLEVWESKEAHDKAMGKYIGRGTSGELAKKGYYEKVMPMVEKYSSAFGTLVASSE